MTPPPVKLYSEQECGELNAFLVERIYEFNSQATGYSDGKLIGGAIQGETGEVIAAFDGHTWGGCCVITHVWVHQSHRGHGLGTALLQAAELEAKSRACKQVVLSTHSFQAPSFYERFGYERQAVIGDQPRGYASIIYLKRLGNGNA